jgi:hypothetical protein
VLILSVNLKIWLALVAACTPLAILILAPNVSQGTGLIVATLAAGVGWLLRDVIEGERILRTICQAYASLIEAHFEEISDSLSDKEIERFELLAPKIVDGSEAEAVGARAADPFASLPDIRDHLHLLTPRTVRFLWKWRTRSLDLFLIYDQLGTKAMSSAGAKRLHDHCEWIKQYRDEYRDIGYTALKCLASDAPSLEVDLRLHTEKGAKEL